MKNSIILIAMIAAMPAFAQSTYVDNNNHDMLRHHGLRQSFDRQEIVLPKTVNGLMPLKADLHIHTYYSDGDVSPQYRVREAWADGLDAIAITDHIEYRPHDKEMARYVGADECKSDLNVSSELAQKEADYYPLIVIKGTEITRNAVKVGHYNAIFTSDNNAIPNDDPMQAIRNAKAQNALVVLNHPGWRRTSVDIIDFEQKAFDENLIDGIEVMNSHEFYPKVIDRALDKELFMLSCTDIHHSSHDEHGKSGRFRDMTIAFVDEPSADGLRRALEARKTITYNLGTIAGERQLLKDFFLASVSIKRFKGYYYITNNTSLEYSLRPAGGNLVVLKPMTTVSIKENKDGSLTFEIENMWCGAECHPSITLNDDML